MVKMLTSRRLNILSLRSLVSEHGSGYFKAVHFKDQVSTEANGNQSKASDQDQRYADDNHQDTNQEPSSCGSGVDRTCAIVPDGKPMERAICHFARNAYSLSVSNVGRRPLSARSCR